MILFNFLIFCGGMGVGVVYAHVHAGGKIDITLHLSVPLPALCALRMEGHVTGCKIRFLVIVVVHHRWRLVLVLLGHKLII